MGTALVASPEPARCACGEKSLIITSYFEAIMSAKHPGLYLSAADADEAANEQPRYGGNADRLPRLFAHVTIARRKRLSGSRCLALRPS